MDIVLFALALGLIVRAISLRAERSKTQWSWSGMYLGGLLVASLAGVTSTGGSNQLAWLFAGTLALVLISWAVTNQPAIYRQWPYGKPHYLAGVFILLVIMTYSWTRYGEAGGQFHALPRSGEEVQIALPPTLDQDHRTVLMVWEENGRLRHAEAPLNLYELDKLPTTTIRGQFVKKEVFLYP